MKTKKREIVQESEADAVVADEMLPTVQVEDIATSYASYLQLKNTQKAVLKVICDDFLSGDADRTDVEIAELAGISRKTVYNCKRNHMFNRAILEIMPELVKAKLPRYLSMIEKHGEKDYRALKFLLEYAGLYVQRSQQAILHAKMDARDNFQRITTPKQAIDQVVQNFGNLGYNKQRLLTEISESWDRQKEQGAF